MLITTQEELNDTVFPHNTMSITIKPKNKNTITTWPESLIIPSSVVTFTMKKTRIKALPIHCFDSCFLLETLDLAENDLVNFNCIIPPRLTDLNLSFNALENVDIDARHLENLDLQFNNLGTVPRCIHHMLGSVNLGYNNFSRNQQKIIKGIYQRNYDNSNNVHQTHVVSCTMRQIQELIDKNLQIRRDTLVEIHDAFPGTEHSDFRNQIFDLWNDYYLYQYNYSTDNDKISYKSLIQFVWSFINVQDSDIKQNLLLNFNIQILDGIKYCHVGKVSRIINTLLGHLETSYELPLNTKLSMKIDQLKKTFLTEYHSHSKEYAVTQFISRFQDYMNDLQVSPEEQFIWLEPLGDLLNSLSGE